VAGPLGEIERIVQESGVHAPALTIVGGVTTMYPRMAWYERLPLFGRSVLVTRPSHQANELERPLVELGAEVIVAPVVEIRPPADQAAMDAALRRLGEYDLVAFTSVNGVRAFVRRCGELGIDARALGKAKIAAVGSATEQELTRNFLRPDIVPGKFTTQALAEAIIARSGWRGKKVLLARADIATPVLPDALKQAGADVDEVDFYSSARCESLPTAAIAAIQDRRLNWITFTSSSAVTNFMELLKLSGLSPDLLKEVRIAAIGPVTAETAEKLLRRPDVLAENHTVEGLIDALVEFVKK
jgi:uroporphyrinogen III methyltransferase/synthase